VSLFANGLANKEVSDRGAALASDSHSHTIPEREAFERDDV